MKIEVDFDIEKILRYVSAMYLRKTEYKIAYNTSVYMEDFPTSADAEARLAYRNRKGEEWESMLCALFEMLNAMNFTQDMRKRFYVVCRALFRLQKDKNHHRVCYYIPESVQKQCIDFIFEK